MIYPVCVCVCACVPVWVHAFSGYSSLNMAVFVAQSPAFTSCFFLPLGKASAILVNFR